MKFKVELDVLKSVTNGLGQGVPTRPVLPILSCVHVTNGTRPNSVVFTVSNLEATASMTVDAEVEGYGEVCVPYDKFAQLVGTASGPVTCDVNADNTMKFMAGKTTATVKGLPGADFPQNVVSGNGLQSFTVTPADWTAGVSSVYEFCAKDDTRPVLMGILVGWSEAHGLSMTGADGYAMSSYGSLIDPTVSVVVPARILNAYQRAIGTQSVLTVDVYPNAVRLSGDTLSLSIQIVEGKYPDVMRLVPTAFGTSFVVDANTLYRALNAVAIFAQESNRVVKMTPGVDGISLYGEAQESGNLVSDVPATVTLVPETPVTISYNYYYMQLALKEEGEVTISYNTPANPLHVKGSKRIVVVMPMSTH